MDDLSQKLDIVIKDLNEWDLPKDLSTINLTAKFQLWGWYGVMPIFLSGYAIYLTL